MSKKYWYIWFSLFACMILWGDTSRRIKRARASGSADFPLWGKACRNIMKLWFVYVIIPTVLIGGLLNFIFPEESSAGFVNTIWMLSTYFLGVYATYRHSVWREKNISHLMKQ